MMEFVLNLILLNQGNGVVYCENIQVLNCKVRSSASAIKLGTNSYGGFKNIVIKNIQVYDTYRSAIAIQSVDGGVIENIIVENVYAINTGNALFIRLGNRIRNRGEDAKAGSIKGIHIKDLTCEVPLEHPDYKYQIRGPELPFFHNVLPSSIVGMPYSKIEDVVLENVKILYPGGEMLLMLTCLNTKLHLFQNKLLIIQSLVCLENYQLGAFIADTLEVLPLIMYR